MLSANRRLILAGLPLLAACATTAAAHPQADLAALDAFDVAWREAYAKGDTAALSDLYELDAWLMTRDQPAKKGRDAIVAYFAAVAARGGSAKMEFRYEDRAVDRPYAFLTARWWLTVERAGAEPYRDSGRSLLVMKRGADGKWRVWRDMDNRTPDAVFPVPTE